MSTQLILFLFVPYFSTFPDSLAAAPPPAPAPAPVVEAPPAPAPVISEPEPVVAEEPAAAPAGASVPVTVTLIKELRESTGAGMMDCKRALIDNDGDIEAASDFLRKSGLAKADKKAARIAAEGKIVAATLGQKSVVVEVNCETDFVAKDGSFLKYAAKVANAALAIDGENIDSLMASEIEGTSLEVERQALVSTIGENIQVRRMASMGGEGATTGSYVHMGKIGVLVELQGGTEQLAIDVGMHVAAMNPPFATSDQVPQEELEKERKMLTEQALESGKPEAIVEKMVDGRIRKYLEEICLDSQTYVKTNDKTVGELIEQAGAKLIGFKRIAVGEGIAKKEEDFAAEVAAASAGN